MLAICSKTLLSQPILDEIISSVPEFSEAEINNRSLFFVMLYDAIFGEGIRVFFFMYHFDSQGGGQIAKLIRSANHSIDIAIKNKMKVMHVERKEDLIPQDGIAEVFIVIIT